MKKYSNIKAFRFTDKQMYAFKKLELYGVDVSRFVRNAIAEKIKKDWPTIKERKQKIDVPF